MGRDDGARGQPRVQHPEGGGGAVAHDRAGPALALRIDELDRVDSTQELLKRRIESGSSVHGLVVRAREQTGAYGRRGRRFEAGLGGSYQSLALRDLEVEVALARGVAPAVAIGIGIAETLNRYGARVGLKWPNDLLYLERKLGGILCERVKGYLVVGVGINVANAVPEGAIGLRGWDVDGVSMAALEGVQLGLGLMVGGGGLRQSFAAYDRWFGLEVEVRTPASARRIGVADGVDELGRLLVRTPGRTEIVERGTVRLVRQ